MNICWCDSEVPFRFSSIQHATGLHHGCTDV